MVELYCKLVVEGVLERVVFKQEHDVLNEFLDAVSVDFPSRKVERDSNIVKSHSHNTSCRLFQFHDRLLVPLWHNVCVLSKISLEIN